MEYFIKISACCAICFLGVLAGLQFAGGNIIVGILQLTLAAINFPTLMRNFKDY